MKKKNVVKKAAFVLPCAAAMAGGMFAPVMPDWFLGMPVGVLAEDAESQIIQVRLNELKEDFGEGSPVSGEVREEYSGKQYVLNISNQDSERTKYVTISGTNYVNNSYVDMRIVVSGNCAINFDNVYIRNDDGDYVPSSGGGGVFTFGQVENVIEISSGKCSISGKIAIDMYSDDTYDTGFTAIRVSETGNAELHVDSGTTIFTDGSVDLTSGSRISEDADFFCRGGITSGKAYILGDDISGKEITGFSYTKGGGEIGNTSFAASGSAISCPVKTKARSFEIAESTMSQICDSLNFYYSDGTKKAFDRYALTKGYGEIIGTIFMDRGTVNDGDICDIVGVNHSSRVEIDETDKTVNVIEHLHEYPWVEDPKTGICVKRCSCGEVIDVCDHSKEISGSIDINNYSGFNISISKEAYQSYASAAGRLKITLKDAQSRSGSPNVRIKVYGVNSSEWLNNRLNEERSVSGDSFELSNLIAKVLMEGSEEEKTAMGGTLLSDTGAVISTSSAEDIHVTVPFETAYDHYTVFVHRESTEESSTYSYSESDRMQIMEGLVSENDGSRVCSHCGKVFPGIPAPGDNDPGSGSGSGSGGDSGSGSGSGSGGDSGSGSGSGSSGNSESYSGGSVVSGGTNPTVAEKPAADVNELTTAQTAAPVIETVEAKPEVSDSGKTVFVDENGEKVTKAVVETVNEETGEKEMYFTNKRGEVVENKVIKLESGEKLIAKEDGKIAVNEMVTAPNGKTYFAGETGAVLKNAVVEVDGKKFATNKNGVVITNKKVMIDGVLYKANKKGVLKKVKQR